jgi:hypothetical protein
MQVFQWDGGCNEIVTLYEVTPLELAGLEELDLKERLDCLEAKAEVVIEQWFDPARDRKYSETPGGTWILSGRYGRDIPFVIAVNPKDDKLGREEMKEYVVAMGEFDDPPGDAA